MSNCGLRSSSSLPKAISVVGLPMVLLSLLLAPPLEAQPVLEVSQDLDFDRPESWAMKYFASATLLTGLGTVSEPEPGAVDLALEVGWLPSLSAEERRVGFDGAKVEDLNRASLFPRPRVLVGLPAGLSLEGSWVPPVDIDGVEPNLLGLALGRPLLERGRWRLGARLHGQYGTLEGDITCPAAEAAAGPDPELNPFLCEAPSRDELTLRSVHLELVAARRAGASGLEPYAALGAGRMELDFRIRAEHSGFVDRTRQQTEGSTWYAAAGVAYRGWRRGTIGLEAFYSPLDVIRPPATSAVTDELFNLRAFFRYTVRH